MNSCVIIEFHVTNNLNKNVNHIKRDHLRQIFISRSSPRSDLSLGNWKGSHVFISKIILRSSVGIFSFKYSRSLDKIYVGDFRIHQISKSMKFICINFYWKPLSNSFHHFAKRWKPTGILFSSRPIGVEIPGIPELCLKRVFSTCVYLWSLRVYKTLYDPNSSRHPSGRLYIYIINNNISITLKHQTKNLHW